MARPAWDFCPVVQQLAWLFSSTACFIRVSTLVACQSRVTRQVSASLHNLEHFFTLPHSLPLHDSHLNTRLLIAKIQANLAQNKANKMVDKIQPYIDNCLHSISNCKRSLPMDLLGVVLCVNQFPITPSNIFFIPSIIVLLEASVCL